MTKRSARYRNRELSWLEFNERVLQLAEDPTTPLLERAKFLAIFDSNLNEFFQVRVAGLQDQVDGGVTGRTPDGRSASQQLAEIGAVVSKLCDRADRLFVDTITPELARNGVRLVSWDELGPDDQAELRLTFEREIFPVLTPLAVDPGHPFPYISNLSLNLAVVVVDPDDGVHRFARVKVPPLLDRFLSLADGERVIPIEQVIGAHLDRLFKGMEVVSKTAFRVTRNADLLVEDDQADDLLEAVEMEVRQRRFGNAVRLEVESTIEPEILDLLATELELTDAELVYRTGPIDLGGLWSVYALDHPDLKWPAVAPVTPRPLRSTNSQPVDIFDVMNRRDILVQHPYESFSTTTEEFVRQAASDPAVQAIKITLYRTSRDSSIVESLIRAAEAGIQVVALVELKARFDEETNIEWARRLERAGVHVVYGLVGLKTHTKITIVARSSPSGVRTFVHIGTGNYNSKTARIYEDFGLLTSAPDVGADLLALFNRLTGYARDSSYERLLVAPTGVREGIIELIEHEAQYGTAGRIVMKMNSLVDSACIDALYAASQQGVRIDLIVRGICCLRPQVPGLSDHITVRSIVGMYLEHSRIYRFSHGDSENEPTTYIGSADLMPRNLDRRVEALVRLTDGALQERIDLTLDLLLADDTNSWELVDDEWHRRTGRTVSAHQAMHDIARGIYSRPTQRPG